MDNRNSSAAKRARTDGSRREDDWTCPTCANVNFSFRTTCNMRNCTQPRPADHSIKPAAKPAYPVSHAYSSSAPYAASAAAVGSPSAMYLNMPPHYAPPLAKDAPYPFGGSGYHYNYGARAPPSGGSPYRPMHFSAPPPYSTMPNGGIYGIPQLTDRYGMSVPMGHHAPMGPRPVFYADERSLNKSADATRDNDWKCPGCGNVNFSFRTVCNMRKCTTPKPETKPLKSEKTTNENLQEGSWKCEKCNNINYPFRTKCNRQNCGADKPSNLEKSPSPPSNDDNQVCFVKQFLYVLHIQSFLHFCYDKLAFLVELFLSGMLIHIFSTLHACAICIHIDLKLSTVPVSPIGQC